MNILISNDDGIESEGIFTLANALSKNNNVIVVAPDGNRSGFSHSLSVNTDLTFSEKKLSDNFKSYTLSGTPADCVKFAFHYFTDIKFDVVCSGINIGNNLGSDTCYSGTVSAGLEGNFFGVPSIAFSLVAFNDFRWDTCEEVIKRSFSKLLGIASPKFTLNVNIPNVPFENLNGAKLCRLGRQLYTDNYAQVNKGFYRLIGEPLTIKQDECDVTLTHENYVSVTPVLYDRTDVETVEKYKDMELL